MNEHCVIHIQHFVNSNNLQFVYLFLLSIMCSCYAVAVYVLSVIFVAFSIFSGGNCGPRNPRNYSTHYWWHFQLHLPDGWKLGISY